MGDTKNNHLPPKTIYQKTIYLRAETKADEYRTPLVPEDAKKLLEAGYQVLVESSSNRCFKDEAYKVVGCELTKAAEWIHLSPSKNTWILGLKELPTEPTELTGQHIFFAHCFKGQKGSQNLLSRFKRGKGSLFDLEYLTSENGIRLVAFGYWAGYAGATLALIHWLRLQAKIPSHSKLETSKLETRNLHPTNKETIQKQIQELASLVLEPTVKPRILITGAKGRSGRGAKDALKNISSELLLWDKEETQVLHKKKILEQDILIHCVCVGHPHEQSSEPFLTLADLETPKNLNLICDVTCDVGSTNNLLPIYKTLTTWQKPLFSVKDKLELIALDNLPSLLPKESSLDFSQNLTPLILKLEGKIWQRCKSHFLNNL